MGNNDELTIMCPIESRLEPGVYMKRIPIRKPFNESD